MTIYHFESIENGQLSEGYCVVTIQNHKALIAAGDKAGAALAEKYGGIVEKGDVSQKESKPKGGAK